MTRITGRFAHLNDRVVAALLVVVGVGTASPVLAVVAAADLDRQYGVTPEDPLVVALLQHRGVLQAALGAWLVAAAIRPQWLVPAAATAVVTKVAFLALLLLDGEVRERATVLPVVFDVASVAVLALVVAARTRRRPAPPDVLR
ncbi:MAG: hypothetical protein ACRCY8_14550 [Dermatophilaceae bacterium]